MNSVLIYHLIYSYAPHTFAQVRSTTEFSTYQFVALYPELCTKPMLLGDFYYYSGASK